MVSINYSRLFNLTCSHDYFKNLKESSISLQPTRETEKVLRGGNMLFKTIPNGIVILYRAGDDEVTPKVELSHDLRLTFKMKVDNKAAFNNITDLDESSSRKYRSDDVVYFKNDPANASTKPDEPETITHKLLDSLESSLFTYNFDVSGSPGKVFLEVQNTEGDLFSVGKDADGSPLPKKLEIPKNDEGRYEQQIDLRGKPPGKFIFKVFDAGDSLKLQEEIYIDDRLASQDILGIVDIVYESVNDHLYGDTEQYKLEFSSKEAFWKYFIVNKNKNIELSGNTLFIKIPGSGTANFNRVGNEPHDDIKVNGLDTVVFKSDNPIPFHEIPKASVQLGTNPDDDILINNLPNPSRKSVVKDRAGGPETEIFVFI
jgi:hypothetical protein